LSDRRGLAVMGGAVGDLTVAAGIAVSMLLGGRGGLGLQSASPANASETSEPSPRFATPTPASSATPDPTQAPTPTPAPSGPATVSWSEGESHPGSIRQVVHHGELWIAGGSVQIGDFMRAAVWTSPDGRAWNGPIALPPEPAADDDGIRPRYWINGFGERDGALLAFGWNGVGCCDGGYPMMWSSEDGRRGPSSTRPDPRSATRITFRSVPL
jgi:hypothetical protein